jgi:hypothetical protein
MTIATTRWRNRRAWVLDNDALALTVLQGGGHLAALTRRDAPRVSPYWSPIWETVEPWRYSPARHQAALGSRLLASIAGHNLCLPWFGGASEAEAAAGMDGHGESSVTRWRAIARQDTAASVSLTCGCVLPVAGIAFTRQIAMKRGANTIRIRERLRSLVRRDQPFTMCQHVTLSPPFLEKGVTLFDAPATRSHTFPTPFEGRQTLKTDAAFAWPDAPLAAGGTVSARTIPRATRRSSDFTTQLMDPRRDAAWFSALNPRLGLALAYVWRREDFPWLGMWTENYGRPRPPWAGRSLTRGMEFANTPFPEGLRRSVERGRFHGLPTFRWLPARGSLEFRYEIVYTAAPRDARGVADIRRQDAGYALEWIR